MSKVLSIILGGGKGTRLYPLTKDRSKPAVPFGAKYRIVDIPISNSINSGFMNIYILTQFNTASLHMHIAKTYVFDSFSKGFVEILAAEQTNESTSWYEGTADAVRKNFHHFRNQNPSHYIILSGDQLYRMDLREFLKAHIDSGADVTVAATPVPKEQTPGFGILRADQNSRIAEFLEKPPANSDISRFKIPADVHPDKEQLYAGKEYLASMGIYVFKASAMEKALANDFTDFGKEIIPQCIQTMLTTVYVYTDFWEDIGTIKSFYDTNLNLASINPDFNFYLEDSPIFTHRRDLPASKFNYSILSQALTGDGCIITNATITNSVIGIRTIMETGSSLDGVVCMGADFYETPEQRRENRRQGIPDIGIGRGAQIRKAIIDKNARIGENCRIGVDPITRQDGEYEGYFIRDGIIIVPKHGAIMPGSVI